MEIHSSHRVFLHEAAIQRPSTTVEEVRRPGQEMPRLNSRRQLAKTGWYNPSTCRCCTSRSSSASCCSRCATCNRNYICFVLPATETKEMKQTWGNVGSARWTSFLYPTIFNDFPFLINSERTFISIIAAHTTCNCITNSLVLLVSTSIHQLH